MSIIVSKIGREKLEVDTMRKHAFKSKAKGIRRFHPLVRLTDRVLSPWNVPNNLKTLDMNEMGSKMFE